MAASVSTLIYFISKGVLTTASSLGRLQLQTEGMRCGAPVSMLGAAGTSCGEQILHIKS